MKTCKECKHFFTSDEGKCEDKGQEHWCYADDDACKSFCSKQPPTNGDVIRQMSNEALAKTLRMCRFCAYYGECLTDPNKNGQCYYGRLAWLNAPAESEKE